MRDTRYEWAYIFGAVCPARATGAALVLPFADTEAMNLHLAEIARTVAPGAHAVLVLDGAGWHGGQDLAVPDNISLLTLPPYAPELNPQEHVWDELREKEFPNRVFNHMDAVIAQLHTGLPRLARDHDRVRSLTAWPWIVSLNLNAH